jgi:pimeloyl-ACP methyl ester carboxylesterase
MEMESYARRICLGLVLVVVALLATAAAAAAHAHPPLGTNGAPVPQLDWGPCIGATPEETEQLADYECTSAAVPLSYRDPRGPRIELALGRLPAADPSAKLGSLFWNPGGPGASGKIPPPFSPALHERFDIVGFDPRGIAESTPLRCFASNEQAFELFGFDFPITREQELDVIRRSVAGTGLCGQNGGPVMSHMATGNVARDLDLLRQAVGDKQLTYLGFSYGTHVGEVYANLFPDRVRALALDAVIDPVEWTTGESPREREIPVEFRAGSFIGAYDALQTFLAACASDDRCAFADGRPNLLRKYDRLLKRLRRDPLELVDPDGQPFVVTYQVAVYTTLGGLYDPAAATELGIILQDLWTATQDRRHTRLERRAIVRPRRGLLRQEEPYFGFEWTPAVQCTDSDNPSNPFVWPFWARKADRIGPYFGSAWLYFALPCATWPVRDPDRYTGPWDRRTANPVLLIGNRLGDPATRYEDAVSTQRRLADARLLMLNSFGHTAFGKSACVVAAVELYLIEQQPPRDGTVCEPDFGPFDPRPAETAAEEALAEALAPVPVP